MYSCTTVLTQNVLIYCTYSKCTHLLYLLKMYSFTVLIILAALTSYFTEGRLLHINVQWCTGRSHLTLTPRGAQCVLLNVTNLLNVSYLLSLCTCLPKSSTYSKMMHRLLTPYTYSKGRSSVIKYNNNTNLLNNSKYTQ